jgi:hypothetical protein
VIDIEWLTCEDPGPMLAFLRGKVGGRKFRLFACACCRRVGHLLSDERSARAVGVAVQAARREAAAASEVTRSVRAMRDAAWGDAIVVRDHEAAREAAPDAAWAVEQAAAGAERTLEPDALYGATEAVWRCGRAAWHSACDAADPIFGHASSAAAEAGAAARRAEGRRQAHLLRDLVGLLPFVPVEVDPGWLVWDGGLVPKLARALYDEGRFEDLPVLADALEDAGCDSRPLLRHCREPGHHVRGCWAVDLVLGWR